MKKVCLIIVKYTPIGITIISLFIAVYAVLQLDEINKKLNDNNNLIIIEHLNEVRGLINDIYQDMYVQDFYFIELLSLAKHREVKEEALGKFNKDFAFLFERELFIFKRLIQTYKQVNTTIALKRAKNLEEYVKELEKYVK